MTITSWCSYCKERKAYESDFIKPIKNTDSEIKFRCISCKRQNALVFYSNELKNIINDDINKQKEVNEMAKEKKEEIKEKKIKKVSSISDSSWKKEKQEICEKLVALAKKEYPNLNDSKFSSVLSGAYFLNRNNSKSSK